MFALPLKAKYSRRRAPLMVKTCKRHTHTYKYTYKHVRVCISVCVCVSLMGRRWLFGGKPQLDCVAVCFCCTWQQVSPVCRCLRLASCASRSTAFALLLLGELALIEGQGQRAFASAAAHVRLRRRRVESTRQGAVPSCCCCTVLQACLCVCVSIMCMYCVCVLHVK